MKHTAALLLVFAIVASASCRRSNNVTSQTVDNARPNADIPPVHRGIAELVGQTNRNGHIKAIALANELNSLLVSDGTIISEDGIDLELLSLEDLQRTASFTITDAMSRGYPWASDSLAVDKGGSKVLLYNQYIDLKTSTSKTALNIQSAIGRKNVRPEPLDISPSGELALICVNSYWSRDESTLATFNLITGELMKKLSRGENTAYGSACFLDNDRVLSIGYDGVIINHSLRDDSRDVSTENGPTPLLGGRNLCVQLIANDQVLISGQDEIVVYDTKRNSIVLRKQSNRGNAIIDSERMLLVWQANSLNPSKDRPKPNWPEPVLAVVDLRTKKRIAEYELPTYYDLILMRDDTIYAVHYDELHKLKIEIPDQ